MRSDRQKRSQKQRQLMDAWLVLLCAGSVALTLFELVLVNRKFGIFQGGFIAMPLEGTLNITLLIVSVYMANMAFASIPLELALWASDRVGFLTSTVLTLSLFLSFFPILTADVIRYEVAKYLGDGVSFFLLRTIGGGSFLELLAQGSAHLVWLGLGIALALVLLYVFVVLWLRWLPLPRVPLGGRRGVYVTCGIMAAALMLVAGSAQKEKQLNLALKRFPASYVLLEAMELLTDWDGDGSAMFSIPPDPQPRDARVYPYAPDIPDNGVDENGLLGDFTAKAFLKQTAFSQTPVFKRRPHFVLLVLESFRADLISKTLQGKEITPHLNKLAAEGLAAEWAFCHNGFTIGALKALFLGNPLHPGAPGSLMDDFKSNGYETACVSGQDESFGDIAKTVGLVRADHFYDARQDKNQRSSTFTSPGSLTVPGVVVLERLSQFLKERGEDPRPLFLYLNLQDTHFPYQHYAMKPLIIDSPLPRSRMRPANAESLLRTYLNAAANVDVLVGDIVRLLEDSLKGEVAMIVVADHGESLFDDGSLGHGHHLTDFQMRIPLIVKGFPARIEEPLGQDEIREMIHQALSIPEEDKIRPARIAVAGKKVFQWLGNVTTPSRISWAGRNERWIVDLHHNRICRNGGAWRKLGAHTNEFSIRELVHYWEALQLRQLGFNF